MKGKDFAGVYDWEELPENSRRAVDWEKKDFAVSGYDWGESPDDCYHLNFVGDGTFERWRVRGCLAGGSAGAYLFGEILTWKLVGDDVHVGPERRIGKDGKAASHLDVFKIDANGNMNLIGFIQDGKRTDHPKRMIGRYKLRHHAQRKLTAEEEKFVGSYESPRESRWGITQREEAKKDEDTFKLVLLENGTVEFFDNAEKQEGYSVWNLVKKEVHVPEWGRLGFITQVYKIESNGDLTQISEFQVAKFKVIKTTGYPNQLTYKKIK